MTRTDSRMHLEAVEQRVDPHRPGHLDQPAGVAHGDLHGPRVGTGGQARLFVPGWIG